MFNVVLKFIQNEDLKLLLVYMEEIYLMNVDYGKICYNNCVK